MASNGFLRCSTAQAILASLLAKATTATLRWALHISSFAQPCGEIAAVVEIFRSTDSGNERRRDNRAEAGDRRQPVGLFVLLRPADEFSIKGCDPSIEFRPLGAGVLDEQDYA